MYTGYVFSKEVKKIIKDRPDTRFKEKIIN